MFNLKRLMAALAASTMMLLAACGANTSSEKTTVPASSDKPNEVKPDESAFPVTIQHAFGETTIESVPQRVATVAWANHEVPLSFGIVPVGMTKTTWSDDDSDGLLPWVKDKLDELGAETPVLFDESDAIPFEEVANTKPDVILASYSGITPEDYEQLSKIAPTVAFPEAPWTTSYQEMIQLNAKALGLAEQGDKLIEDLQGKVNDALAEYPDLKGKKVLFSYLSSTDLSKVGFYTADDPRAGFIYSNGFLEPKIVSEKAQEGGTFYHEVSPEQPELFDDVELIITYGTQDAEAELAALQADPLVGRIPAVKEGRVAFLGENPLAAASNMSPLSIEWGIKDYFKVLNDALN